MELYKGSKQIQTGHGVVKIKFTDKAVEVRLERNLHPDDFDWEQIKDIFMGAAGQAFSAAEKGVLNYWETLSMSSNAALTGDEAAPAESTVMRKTGDDDD